MQLKQTIPIALTAALAYAQDDSDSGSGSSGMTNLTALLSSTDSLSSLNDLVGNYPDFAAALASREDVTILAPSNDALETLMNSDAASMLDNDQFVQALLNYHVINGTVYASNITQTPIFAPTYLNSSMYSNVTGGQVVEARREDGEVQFVSGLKQVSTVAQPNVNYTNGVVHIIDEVLMIPGNLTSTAQNANLTAFLGAAQNASVAQTLLGAEDLTIFAPSNSAFQDIGSLLGNITMDQLANILSYHVIEGTVAYSSDLSNTSLTTLQGDDVQITIANGSVMVNNATVTNANILFAGGVIHVIDQVLNPNANSSSSSNSSSSDSGSDNAFGATSSASEVPFTSGQPAPTTTYTELVTSTSQVIISQTPTGGAGNADSDSSDSDSSDSSSSSTDGAWIAKPTGAMGAAALFGGAAFLAGM
ncbi:hypothetical protein KC332_g7026 [Hortaea werneckii]|uniref:FAS1 domain-containing protein n=2 Tax=Hortaea werneckii TaxID=91943 RepID=A0A3M7IFX9_HORWE|nr:hypothetical protein KC350_g9801 [Hortaea werneckii]OTA32384.1 hypothetical protein BTJ68_07959 [Hortaea werneckii EXF-2000]KAI6830963.1 hypothetical protein KC358_g6672 [Hortaea werneckii]KAI6930261.1 hypothetical protein KC341_g10352 [Hortaea werneckii]KAI6932264.1 hypothetical protein KC348_g7044 [Hortaea werneckii]